MAVEEKMVILADEVYQANIWKKGASFSSFKKVRWAEKHGDPVVPFHLKLRLSVETFAHIISL